MDELRAGRGRDLPKWPNWCFLPLAGFYSIISADAGVSRLPPHLAGDVGRLAALGIWRATQGVYEFDDVFEKALEESPISGSIPVDVLFRLPEWCVYIKTPGHQYMGDQLHGFFAHLEWDANTQRTELRLLMDCEKALTPFVLHIGKWTITEALDRSFDEASKQAGIAGVNFAKDIDAVEKIALELRPLLSLILYLCSEEPEYSGGVPSRPRPKKTKKGWRLFPPSKPKIIKVGNNIGQSLKVGASRKNSAESDGVRPHIRRGHWHGYWTGPKSQKQKFIFKWLPPMGVNVDINNT